MTRGTRPPLSLFLASLVVVLAPLAARAYAIDHLQDKTDIGRNKVPHRGTSRILVIPSRTGVSTFPQERWRALEDYFDPEGGPGTFRSYWQTQSRGAYDPIPFLAEPVLYPDDCPLPEKDLLDCRILIEDYDLLFSGQIRTALKELVERVRDEQGVDLAQFDVNGMEENVPDGWFDGIILSTDLFDGLGLPLAALEQDFTVHTTPRPPAPVDGGDDGDGGSDGGDELDAGDVDAGDLGPSLGVGVMAFIPPDRHEFGHNLGFMDLYHHDPVEWPVITDLMGRDGSGLSAHSRLAIGWGDNVVDVTGPLEMTLEPVLEGGAILRFGAPPRYVLVENRSGFVHNQTEEDPPGVYLYSVDENELPTGPLGFIDVQNGELFLPNDPEPKQGNVDCVEDCYLNVNIPVGCRFAPADDYNSCALGGDGVKRNVAHASDGHLGFYLEQVSSEIDGTKVIRVVQGEVVAEPDAGPADDAGPPADAGGGGDDDECSCRAATSTSAPWGLALLFLALFACRPRRRA